MLKKKISYVDYNGVNQEETFYFNLSKSEVMEMELMHPGGYTNYLQRIIEGKDQVQVMEAFRKLILDSYGVKSDDGRHFKKSKELSEDFYNSEAYSELFMELVTKEGAAAAFVNGIMPVAGLEEDQKRMIAAKTKELIDSKSDASPQE